MDRKLAEPSHQLIDKICDQREGDVLLWHSLLIGKGRGESHCIHIVPTHYLVGAHTQEGFGSSGRKMELEQKWQKNYG